MKKFFHIIIIVASVMASAFMASSCTKIEEASYDIVGYWKFTGFNGKDYPDDYHYLQITNDMIVVYDRHENLVNTFDYTRTNNVLSLSAPFAGEYTSIHVDSATHDTLAKLGQMVWECGKNQKYYFGLWDRE